MSSPIHSLLADELNVSEERAEKLLIAMLREVRKRAHREGVRLPDLGTFREDNGRLTFEPTPSLARAVNHEYEGLPSEDFTTEEPSNGKTEKDEGPSTAILGTDTDGWSPIESSAAEEQNEDPDDPSDADTEEFQIPSAEETADTEEFQAPEPSTAKEPDPDPESNDSSSEVEELYPLVEEATESEAEEESPSGETTPSEEDDESSQEDLAEIWESDTESTNDREHEKEVETASSPSSSSQPSVSDPSSEPTTGSPSSDSTGVPWILPLLLLLVLLGGAGWYVLGQRGTLPPPATVIAGVTAEVQETVRSVPLFDGSPRSGQETEDEDASPSQEVSTPEDSEGDQNEPSGEAPSTDSDNSEGPPSPEIDREAGGWTIVVASRTDQATAESLVTTFRDRFEAASVPVDVVTGEVNNTTRYRVAIGQYRTRNEAQQAMNEFGDELPEGAWPLRLR